MKQSPYVKSNYERIEDDDYKTIDTRCIDGLLFHVSLLGTIVDCCAPTGSAILDAMGKHVDRKLVCVADAFSEFSATWVVTNPPYKRGLVDAILRKQIERVNSGEVYGFATLMRSNFDFAKSRQDMFEDGTYFGQIKLLFRPYWSTERKASPIHNYVWHIWKKDSAESPVVLYYREGQLWK
jgi:hypothetical protein